jgi:hypothetical protein
VQRAALNIQFFADRALKLNDEKIDSPEVVNHVRFDPAGVAALITPWNGPFMLTTWKVGPCLAAGDTAVVKPPEWAPLTCSMMADLAIEAGLPPGVLNVVQGIGEEAGAALSAHPDIDRLSFTGSTDTAKLIGASTARSLTPVAFELGGKSPFIVCADADLDAAAKTAAQRRQRQIQRVRSPVQGQGMGIGAVDISLAAAAIKRSVTVEKLRGANLGHFVDLALHGEETAVCAAVKQRRFQRWAHSFKFHCQTLSKTRTFKCIDATSKNTPPGSSEFS